MPKTSGLGDAAFVGGYDLSSDVLSLSKIACPIATLDVTPINKSAHVRLFGQRDGEIDFETAFDPDPGQENPVLKVQSTTDIQVMYCRGTAIGNAAAVLLGKQIDYAPTRANTGMLTSKTTAFGNGFGLEWCEQVTPGAMAAANLITGNESTFEASIGTWAAAANCSVAQTSAQAHGGTKSLGITSTASGTMTAQSIAPTPNGTVGFAVAGGASYTVSGWFRTAVSARTCAMQVTWYDVTGTSLSTTTGSTITDSSSAWTQASSVHLAPATAVYAIVLGQVQSTGGASEVHYLDDVLMVTQASTVLDHGASSAFGLQAYMQVTAFTGTDATVTLQDSPDNSTWTNLTNGAFAQTTAAHTTQRIATSNSATVNRYLRAAITTSAGFTSMSLVVVVDRNAVAGVVF